MLRGNRDGMARKPPSAVSIAASDALVAGAG